MAKSWTLAELANLEVLLNTVDVREEERAEVADAIQSAGAASESEQRRSGIRAWYQSAIRYQRDTESKDEAGHRLNLSLGLIQFVIVILSLALGIALMAGLVERVGVTEGKAYNVWKLLAIPIGAQWCFLILAIISWVVIRNNSRKFTFLEEITGQVVKRMAGKEGARGWNELYRAGAAYRSILSWRIARITQWGAVAFNIGIIMGFYAILLFLEINFFWATTIDDFGLPQLERVTNVLSTPWRAIQPDWVPTQAQMLQTQLQVGQLNAEGESKPWYTFLLACMAVWALLPRLIMTGFAYVMEKRELGRLTFMEKRHRELWRKLTPRVNASVTVSDPSDGVVLIDVGGTEATTDEVRPFLLQQIRVNPTQRYTAGVLSEDQKEEALASLQKAKRGVVMLVEGWNLSPKQLTPLHTKIRAAVDDREIFYLVLGLPKAGVTQSPEEEEFQQWQNFVVDLNDPETEVIAYNPSKLI